MSRARGQSGFTLLEVLLVVAILGLISAIAIPVYSRTMRKSQRTAFAAEARQVHQALLAYYADHNKFPAAWSGPDKLNRATLAPLTTEGYLSTQAAESFVAKQAEGQIWFYWAFSIGGKDREIWMIMHPRYDPDEIVYVFHSQLIWGSTWHDGVYFWDGGYKKIDEMKDL